tara:strand:+ start:413 stop:649 length:237 start_codon:yes stop_codon:yes gene_type:complete
MVLGKFWRQVVRYIYDVEVEQTFVKTKTMRIRAGNEEDLNDKVQERTEGDGRRIRATSSEAYIVAIIDEVEEPTAQKR